MTAVNSDTDKTISSEPETSNAMGESSDEIILMQQPPTPSQHLW
jgi:hypothetical protein